jgi:ComF family protein
VLERVLSIVAPRLCTACGAHAGRSAPLCPGCRGALAQAALGERHLVIAGLAVWSAFAYEGPAGALVRSLKFAGRVPLADVMAAQVAAHAPPAIWSGALVPVPLHPARGRRRGFNQAALLAAALGRRTGMAVTDCLCRAGAVAAQTGRGRAERMAAPAHAIRVAAGAAVPGRVLLIDDVVTTGATLAACGKALRNAGCRNIGGITYARTRGR